VGFGVRGVRVGRGVGLADGAFVGFGVRGVRVGRGVGLFVGRRDGFFVGFAVKDACGATKFFQKLESSSNTFFLSFLLLFLCSYPFPAEEYQFGRCDPPADAARPIFPFRARPRGPLNLVIASTWSNAAPNNAARTALRKTNMAVHLLLWRLWPVSELNLSLFPSGDQDGDP